MAARPLAVRDELGLVHDIVDGVYRDDPLDWVDWEKWPPSPCRGAPPKNQWTGHIGAVRRPKTRGQIGREAWMCKMFGNDWRSNGLVVHGVSMDCNLTS